MSQQHRCTIMDFVIQYIMYKCMNEILIRTCFVFPQLEGNCEFPSVNCEFPAGLLQSAKYMDRCRGSWRRVKKSAVSRSTTSTIQFRPLCNRQRAPVRVRTTPEKITTQSWQRKAQLLLDTRPRINMSVHACIPLLTPQMIRM